MIIGQKAQVLPVHAFIEQLQRVSRSVVLVAMRIDGSSSQNSYATGWLITHDLVVIPRHSLDVPGLVKDGIICRQFNPVSKSYDVVAARIEDESSDFVQRRQHGELTKEERILWQEPILLRLDQKLPEAQPVTLELSNPTAHQSLIVLHHPGGVADLQLSMGQVVDFELPTVLHSADTTSGSSGAPVFSIDWKVIGMHGGRDPKRSINEAQCTAYLIDKLRQSSAWPDIAAHHSLATFSSRSLDAPASDSSIATDRKIQLQLAAATRWDFAIDSLSEVERNELARQVANPKGDRWIMRATDRTQALRAASSITQLREARQSSILPCDTNDPRQLVIDEILTGGPFDVQRIPEADLPHWLQAVRWFAHNVPHLPTATDIAKELERRRVRSNLQSRASDHFEGRKTELSRLNSWYTQAQTGPMIISGIGGIGKSALVAQFALELSPDPLILWLDFDRADITSDDAESIVNALIEQTAAQLDQFQLIDRTQESADPLHWQNLADLWAQAIAQHGHAQSVLLVLDSFEIAQHVQRYEEIWPCWKRSWSGYPNCA